MQRESGRVSGAVNATAKPRAAGYIEGKHGYLTQAEFERHRDLGTPGLVWIDDGSYRVGRCDPDDNDDQVELDASDGFDEPREWHPFEGAVRDDDFEPEIAARLEFNRAGEIGGGW
jgi:hypothetical protein